MKKEARVIGIDDGPFVKRRDKKVLVVGVVCRGAKEIDGVLSTTAAVDGTDSTAKIAQMVNKSKFAPQLKAILLNGIAVGGFNVVDIHRLNRLTHRPVIVIVRDYPDLDRIFAALKMLRKKKALMLIQKLPKPEKAGKVWMQCAGTDTETAKEMLKISTTRAFIPEALRIAHIIAAGIVKGESRGRA